MAVTVLVVRAQFRLRCFSINGIKEIYLKTASMNLTVTP